MQLSHLKNRHHIEVTPKLSMNPHANFKTHGGIFDNVRLKTLTDKDIRKYEKQGYYEGVKRDSTPAKANKPKAKRSNCTSTSTSKLARKLTKEQVMSALGL